MPATKAARTRTRRSEIRSWRAASRARCMYHSTGVVRNSRTARSTTSGSAPGIMKPLCWSRYADRAPNGSRLTTGVSSRPVCARVLAMPRAIGAAGEAGDLQRGAHRGEGAARDAGDREKPGHPLGVLDGELEGGVHADRPADHRAGVDPGVVEHRERVLDERLDVHAARVRRPVGAADSRGGSTR